MRILLRWQKLRVLLVTTGCIVLFCTITISFSGENGLIGAPIDDSFTYTNISLRNKQDDVFDFQVAKILPLSQSGGVRSNKSERSMSYGLRQSCLQNYKAIIIDNEVSLSSGRRFRWSSNETVETPPAVQHTIPPHIQYKDYKKLLYWNDVYGDKNFHVGAGAAPFKRCPVNMCYGTHNRSTFDYKDIDVVYWNYGTVDHSLPPVRSPHTMYIFFMLESPHYIDEDVAIFNGLFNWTATYRHDSDFPVQYGKATLLKPTDVVPRAKKNLTAGKKKMAAWFVSHCRTKSDRATVSETLQQYITVDIYGECGTFECTRGKDNFSICGEMLERDYKFYLSFENSLCNDYYTEKLIRMIAYDIIPVVYGMGYINTGLPPKSYIDVFDFESIEDLADYLKYLDSNDTAYDEYFKWKGKYKVLGNWKYHGMNNCRLCYLLHKMDPNSPIHKTMPHPYFRKDLAQYPKVYEDLEQWWVGGSECRVPHHNEQYYHFIRGKSKTEIRETAYSKQPGVPDLGMRSNINWRKDIF